MSDKKEICVMCGCGPSKNRILIKGQQGHVCVPCAAELSRFLQNRGLLHPAMQTSMTPVIKDIKPRIPIPSQIKAHLDQYVVGHDAAKRTLSVAVYNHFKRIFCPRDENGVEVQKSNVLLMGPTGSGKTFLAQTLAKFLEVPFAIADATTLTESGYVGDDVESVLGRLVQNAGGDVEKAQRGIVYIDEIDKISRMSENPSITRDVSGEGVQQALLKIIEGTEAEIMVEGGRKHPHGAHMKVDTSNILFICGGAFDGIDKIIGEKDEKRIIGFFSGDENQNVQTDIQQHHIIKYGMIPELVGRLPVITTLDSLKVEDLRRILTEPKNALIKQYQSLMAVDGVELVFDQDAVEEIAKQALERKIGARGLRSIVEKAMDSVMFDIPDDSTICRVVVTKDVILNHALPNIERTKFA